MARLVFAGGVGVQGQVQVVVPGIGGPDGGGRRHVGGVAGVLNPRGKEHGLHGVCQAVHPLLLISQAVDIFIVFLGGR